MITMSDSAQQDLLRLAADSVRWGELHSAPVYLHPRVANPEVIAPGRAFVSLKFRGTQFGCQGCMSLARSYWENTRHAAYQASQLDLRFPPIRKEHHSETLVEVTVLDSVDREISPSKDLIGSNASQLLVMENPTTGNRSYLIPSYLRNHSDLDHVLSLLRSKLRCNPRMRFNAFKYYAVDSIVFSSNMLEIPTFFSKG